MVARIDRPDLRWSAVDDYIGERLLGDDPVLALPLAVVDG